MIEVFFAKLAKQMLRGIRVESKNELAGRTAYLDQINADPVPDPVPDLVPCRPKSGLEKAHSPLPEATAA